MQEKEAIKVTKKTMEGKLETRKLSTAAAAGLEPTMVLLPIGDRIAE